MKPAATAMEKGQWCCVE